MMTHELETAVRALQTIVSFGDDRSSVRASDALAKIGIDVTARIGAPPDEPGFTCVARTAGGDPPQDCNWPMCGCDPRADRVISALVEADIVPPRPLVQASALWRVGRTLGRTLYFDGAVIGMVDTPELAAWIVATMNETRASRGVFQGVAGSTPAGASTVAGYRMPEGERGVDPAETAGDRGEDSRKSAHFLQISNVLLVRVRTSLYEAFGALANRRRMKPAELDVLQRDLKNLDAAISAAPKMSDAAADG